MIDVRMCLNLQCTERRNAVPRPTQINGRPFVVREADKPFQNLEYTGIDRSRVEDMEARLKADVLREVGLRIINNRVHLILDLTQI